MQTVFSVIFSVLLVCTWVHCPSRVHVGDLGDFTAVDSGNGWLHRYVGVESVCGVAGASTQLSVQDPVPSIGSILRSLV